MDINNNPRILDISLAGIAEPLPDPTGQSGEVLTTDGSGASWEPAAPGGQTLYSAIVASTGGDYTTVGAAIAAGATSIFVRNGTYTESALTVSTANVTITGESRDKAVINIGSNLWNITTTATGFTMQNLKFTSANGRLMFDTVTEPVIDGCRIETAATSNIAIQMYNCSRGQFTNNLYIDSATNTNNKIAFGDGVGLGNHIAGNVFRINPALTSGNIVVGSMNHFVGNSVQHSGGTGTGYLVTGGGICNIESNYFIGRIDSSTSKVCDGINTTAVHCNVVGNYLYEVKGTGIYINSTANVCSGNSIDYSDIAIRIAGSDNIVTSNFHSSATTGVTNKIGCWVDSGNRNVVAHNNFQDNTTGILVDTGLTANQLLYNLVYNNTTPITDNSSGSASPTVLVGNITA